MELETLTNYLLWATYHVMTHDIILMSVIPILSSSRIYGRLFDIFQIPMPWQYNRAAIFRYQESEWEHMVEVSRWVWRLKT